MKKKLAIGCLAALALVVVGAVLLFAFREPLLLSFMESRTYVYLDRCNNSPQLVAEARQLVGPAVDAYRTGKLSEDDQKALMKVWVDLKNNAPASAGGTPLTDEEFAQHINTLREVVSKTNPWTRRGVPVARKS